MGKSKNQEYAEQYAQYAKEQMVKYGIPASVTLAQGILESANGQSQLARKENNHFGIKASAAWLAQGGKYGVYTDDKPNEKFCAYDNVGESFEHHSKVLVDNKRYAQCFTLAPDDYKGWTEEIAKAGYASGSDYDKKLQQIIERNGLDKYDKEVMLQLQSEGKSTGQANAEMREPQPIVVDDKILVTEYSLPLKRDDFLFVTSPFGVREDPLDPSKKQMHSGMDIRCDKEILMATESNGKIVKVNHNGQTEAGKSVTVEYEREDQTKVQVTYAHLDSVTMKVGDTVKAGQQLGISGNTGTRTTGPHLHLEVKTIQADGSSRNVDPAAYLAEISQKGNIQIQALHNGTDLMAKFQTTEHGTQIDHTMTADDWMKKLLSSEDSGIGLGGSHDPIIDFAVTAFSSLMMLAVEIDKKSEEEKIDEISDAVDKKSIDLTSLLPNYKSCTLDINDKGETLIRATTGDKTVSHTLSSNELSRLSVVLNNNELTDESKRLRVAGIVNSVILTKFASQNFEQGMSQGQGQEESLKR